MTIALEYKVTKHFPISSSLVMYKVTLNDFSKDGNKIIHYLHTYCFIITQCETSLESHSLVAQQTLNFNFLSDFKLIMFQDYNLYYKAYETF